MKIAVIGGGTAGSIAVSHLSKYFPDFELFHIYDSRLPTIGVGEGTILSFPQWLKEITDLDYPELNQQYNVTKKYGVSFENWGLDYSHFLHGFSTLGKDYAYHIAADTIVPLLQRNTESTHIDKKVIDLESTGVSVNIVFEDSTNLKVDFAIDATGFPKQIDDNYLQLSAISTNAALIRKAPPIENLEVTRAVARPHGWIFIIPLTHRTSYGYIYNSCLNTKAEITADFDRFLQQENVTEYTPGRQLNFPNFCKRKFFDGSLFTIGNAASFLEPLEATAIAATIDQINLISIWCLQLFSQQKQRCILKPQNIDTFNKFLLKYTYRLSLFVGWHYAKGSAFDTDFWHLAKSNFEQEIANSEFPEVVQKFQNYLDKSITMPHPFRKYPEFDKLCRTMETIHESDSEEVIESKIADNKRFGHWQVPNFSIIGHGIGFYPQTPLKLKQAS